MYIAVDGVVGRRGDSEAFVENQTVKSIEDQPALSLNRQDTKGKMSHLANYCPEKSIVEYYDFLANQPGRYTSTVDLVYQPGQSSRPADLANRSDQLFG